MGIPASISPVTLIYAHKLQVYPSKQVQEQLNQPRNEWDIANLFHGFLHWTPLSHHIPFSMWEQFAEVVTEFIQRPQISVLECFCRHRPSKMRWKMNWKMRAVNLTPSKFSKMSEKRNNTFFSTLAALNSAFHCRLCIILSLSQYYLSSLTLPQAFTNWSLVY